MFDLDMAPQLNDLEMEALTAAEFAAWDETETAHVGRHKAGWTYIRLADGRHGGPAHLDTLISPADAHPDQAPWDP